MIEFIIAVLAILAWIYIEQRYSYENMLDRELAKGGKKENE